MYLILPLSYTILDCITGLIDITFYHVYTLFAYWPFDLTSSRIWFSYDNSVNTISCFHMLYICWSRLRCVQKPVPYKKRISSQKFKLHYSTDLDKRFSNLDCDCFSIRWAKTLQSRAKQFNYCFTISFYIYFVHNYILLSSDI